eukprot:TRINITY_DN1836_c0_g1_i14.p1 TRINITY_DN1836_c0_g1~~TRINITY_DN1836_c0_g1_i14.p1  ORF type:complete len:261 (-),score=16.09 TRINITY_DN1836_c0_g1_i14:177-959(-)
MGLKMLSIILFICALPLLLRLPPCLLPLPLAPPGVYMIPSVNDLRKWEGIIFLRAGQYKNGIFKFFLQIPESYPEEGPRVFFTTPVFHPLIHPKTGELDLSIQFPTWQRNKHYLATAVAYVKRVFYKADMWECPEPFNAQALKLWKGNVESFIRRCEECCRVSVESVYENQADATLRFFAPIPAHTAVFQKILETADTKKDLDFSYSSWFALFLFLFLFDGVENVINYPVHLRPTPPSSPSSMPPLPLPLPLPLHLPLSY